MKTHSHLLNLSLIISTGCFAAGYLLAGYWLVVPALVLLIASWVLSSRRPAFWLAAVSLVSSLILAAVGVALDISLVLIVIATTMALVSWELVQFKHSSTRKAPAQPNTAFEKHHLRSLLLAASAGLILALLTTFINLQLPFGVVAILVLAAVGSLVFSMQSIMKKKIE
jgi:hypothetical protein